MALAVVVVGAGGVLLSVGALGLWGATSLESSSPDMSAADVPAAEPIDRETAAALEALGYGEAPTITEELPAEEPAEEVLETGSIRSFGFDSSGSEIAFAFVEGGTFQRGTSAPRNGMDDSFPPGEVTVDDFWIATTEVTQDWYESVMGHNPTFGPDKGAGRPVNNVTWEDAREFANEASKSMGLEVCYVRYPEEEPPPCGFLLPTHAEWEVAASAGTGATYAGSADGTWEGVAVFSAKAPARVGSLAPNAWGLYDMSGNVGEWVDELVPGEYGKWGYRGVRGGWFGSAPTALQLMDALGNQSSNRSSGLRLVWGGAEPAEAAEPEQ